MHGTKINLKIPDKCEGAAAASGKFLGP